MTAITFQTKLGFVPIVFLVARNTRGLKFFLIEITLVTVDTFHIVMLAQQRILCVLAMIEQDFFPLAISMASLALRPKSTFVFVVFFMALVADFGRLFIFFIEVAFFTLHIDVFACKSKMRLAVIEAESFPVFFLMTILALRSQSAFVFIVFAMAAVTSGRRIAIFFQR
jgi:hypothetical protein